MSPTPGQHRPGGRAPGRARVAALLLLVVAAGLVFSFLYLRRRAKPRPTPFGWQASVLTLAGDGAPSDRDGPQATRAGFQEPFGVAVDGRGNVYVADAGEGNRIRKVTPEGALSTLAGGRVEGHADGPGATAAFHTPSGLAVDGEGNLYVADTGNNRIRKVTPEGVVTTLAGDGAAGYADGPAAAAKFNGPVGVAVDGRGNVYVADTYNDRVRLVTAEGEVRTVAGARGPGYADGPAPAALFDTPCAVAVTAGGDVYVADTGNNRLRRLTKDGQVLTVAVGAPDGAGELSRPMGLSSTHDGFIYVTEAGRGRVLQVAPDGAARLIAGAGTGFADGGGLDARFNQPAGVAADGEGALYVADSANYLVRKVAPAGRDEEGSPSAGRSAARAETSAAAGAPAEALPRLSAETVGAGAFPWPLDPQSRRHEVVATMGEVRGSYDTADSRHHLHSGVDVFGVYGQTVRAVRNEKVSGPLPNWGFGTLNEGMRAGLISYIHLRVGRTEKDEMIGDDRFTPVPDAEGKVARVRIKRGTRLRVGQALGTVNRMYHVHMNYGPPGAEVNPLTLPLVGFGDSVAPKIERDGVQLFDESGARLTGKRAGRLLVRGRVRIVVDAYDQVDGNQQRRRLGLYRLGYQLIGADGGAAPGFERPRVQIEFDRLPAGDEATKIAYADESGITVYGSAATRFLYELTNTVRGGRAERGVWDTSELPAGDYVLRIIAADLAGNEAAEGRDVPITIERP